MLSVARPRHFHTTQRLVEKADAELLHGPADGWAADIIAKQKTVEGQQAQLSSTEQALQSFSVLANDFIFSIHVGSQTRALDGYSVLALGVFVILILIVVVATADQYGLFARLSRPSEGLLGESLVRASQTGGNEPQVRDHLAPLDARASSINGAAEGEAGNMRSVKSAIQPDGGLRAALHCFSLRRNWASLGNLRSEGMMGCLDGLRCFSMAWVIFGHTILYADGAGGPQFLVEIMPKGAPTASFVSPPPNGRISGWLFQLLPGAFFAVDTFFWMSGMLTGFTLAKQMAKLSAAWFKFYPVYVLNRWLRLTPVVGVAMLWVIGLGESVGDGPIWGEQVDRQSCLSSWWVNIVYVQNILMRSDKSQPACLGHLWYLSNDFQFYLAAPLLVFPMVSSPVVGWSVWALAVLGSTAANIAIAIAGGYTASPLFDKDYMTEIYVQPWTRIQPYLVGLALGVLWQRSSGHGPSAALRWSCWALCIGAAAVMIADIFGTHGLYQQYPSTWSRLENVAYISFSRLAWAVALNALAYCCFVRESPVLNTFLSWWPFQIYGKLCFGAYVFHPLVMNAINYASQRYVEYSDIWFAVHFTACLMWASALAVVVWLFVEKPAANLVVLSLSRLGLGGPRTNG